MKNWFRIVIIAGLLLIASACGGGTEPPAPTSAPSTATSAPSIATPVPPTATPAPPAATPRPSVSLGEVQRNEAGGFAFRPIPGYEMLDIDFTGMVSMVAPGADPLPGPVFTLAGWLEDVDITSADLYEEMKDSPFLRFGAAEAITIAGVPGLVAEFERPWDGETIQGRVAVAAVTPRQAFSFMLGGPAAEWEALSPYFDAILASIELFELAAPALPPVSSLEPGWYAYTNPNVARDVLVYDGVVYAATLGGVVIWEMATDLEYGLPTVYTPLDGLSHVSAHALAVCDVPIPGGGRATRIIVGTQLGLSFYDPLSGEWDATPITPEEARIEANDIDVLYCDAANNRLLIGYSGLGILDLETGDWTRFTRDEGLSWNGINDIAVTGRDIWVASGYNGISRISGDQVTIYNEENGLPNNRASAFAVGADGALWVGTSGGLARFRNNQWTFYAAREVSGLYDIRKLVFADDGTLWVGTASMGGGNLCRFDPAAGVCVENYPEAGVFGLALHNYDGAPVYVNSNGVYARVGDTRFEYLYGASLLSNFVDSFASAPDGMLWVGTDSGIHRLDPAAPASDWETYTSKDGVGGLNSWANALTVVRDGTVWAAITNSDASRYRDGEWVYFEGMRSYDSVAVDAQGRAWFGDESEGIVVLNADGSRVMEFTAENGLPSDKVLALLADGETMWIATDSGLVRYSNGELELVIEKDTLPHSYLRDLALDANGRLLIGATLSLLRYDGEQLEVLFNFQKEGYLNWLNMVAVAPDGVIWAGTQNGLFYFDLEAGTWDRWTTADGLLTNFITALHVDQYGAIWVGGGSNFSGGGLLHIVP